MNDKLSIGRLFSRIALIVAFVAALAMPVFAFIVRGPEKPETWTLAAAALAVVTAIISA
jgi:heme A synthase